MRNHITSPASEPAAPSLLFFIKIFSWLPAQVSILSIATHDQKHVIRSHF
jgi:hypothetical protein